MNIAAVLLLASLTFAQNRDPNSCPTSESIIPCTCKKGKDNKPWITCNGIRSSDELKRAANGMQDISVANFDIESSNIGVFPADVFSDMEIQYLSIIKTNLTKLGESRNRPPFLGLEDSLQILLIKNSFVDEKSPLTTLSLSHLKKLASLQLNNNYMPTIGNDWFESGPYSLRDLILHGTKTTTVGSHAFEALENLMRMTFHGSFIKELKREMFPKPATFLELLDLSSNKLQTLPDDMFSQMPSLEKLYLESNQLTTINELVFSPVWGQLEQVNFYDNPIICNATMKWIYKFRTPERFWGHCTGPSKLQNKYFVNLTLSDFE